MVHRISGDTLASTDNVAMMPTTHPAVAGTQESREVGRAVVRVISGEDKRPVASMVSHEPSTGSRAFGAAVMAARLASATVPEGFRDSKWSLAPTVCHTGTTVRSPALRGPAPRMTRGAALRRDRSASGPAPSGAFLLTG